MGLGDELMVTGQCRLLQQKDPRKVRIDYGKRLWSEVFDHNPRIAHAKDKDVQIYRPRPDGLRPYCAGKTPDRWTWQDYKPPIGELYFQPDELAMAEKHSIDVVIEPTVKGRASPNKQWGLEKWSRLVDMITHAGMRPVQLGPPGVKKLHGVKLIETTNFRRACAILRKAKAAVVHEGGMHHGAAVVGVPAVVIYGGFISPKQTGYDLHTNIFTGGEPCGWRIPCKHCQEAMNKISPRQVFDELKKIWDTRPATI